MLFLLLLRVSAQQQQSSLLPCGPFGWVGVQALSQCLSRPPMQHPPIELHSHLGLTLTTLSKSASGVVSPVICQLLPKGAQNCVVDDDNNDVNGEEDENDVTMYAQCTILNFDGGESVEHARGRGRGNNPTVGCEILAGELRNWVEFWRVMGASSFV